MNIKRFEYDEKTAVLYKAEVPGGPLIVFNGEESEGSRIYDGLDKTVCTAPDFLCVEGLDWNRDLSPWSSPAVFKKAEPFAGEAGAFLKLLTDTVLPEVKSCLGKEPSYTGIAGYSLAGLFALYSLYNSDVFDCAASISGSLWFPGFREYVFTHDMIKSPRKIYMSLGDAEAMTRNAVLQTVQKNTEDMAGLYKEQGIDTVFEMNPGNHFAEPDKRCVKGILALI